MRSAGHEVMEYVRVCYPCAHARDGVVKSVNEYYGVKRWMVEGIKFVAMFSIASQG